MTTGRFFCKRPPCVKGAVTEGDWGIVTWVFPATLVASPPAGLPFFQEREERRPGLCPGPGMKIVIFVHMRHMRHLPAAYGPKWRSACPPAGHAAAQVPIPRTRAPAGGAPWPVCRYRKQDLHNQRKGSRGKKLFPLAFFPLFLMGEIGPRWRRIGQRDRKPIS